MLPSTPNILPVGVYIAGEYCDTFNDGGYGVQVPTMEKACESGKLASQQLSNDFGLQYKVQGINFGDLEKYSRSHNFCEKLDSGFLLLWEFASVADKVLGILCALLIIIGISMGILCSLKHKKERDTKKIIKTSSKIDI